MRPRGRWLALGAVVLAVAGCGIFRGTPRVGDPTYGVQVAEGPAVVDFYQRASTFYGRLAHRRFNVVGTYRDEVLREFFRTDRAFSDYYADFAQDLADAHFERRRPKLLDVVEFAFEGPGEAQVQVRIVGDDGRPLRIGEVVYQREDRWERVGGTWWIVPGKL
jgi:hypothetical protein